MDPPDPGFFSTVWKFIRSPLGIVFVCFFFLCGAISLPVIGVVGLYGLYALSMESHKNDVSSPKASPSGKYQVYASIDNDNADPSAIYCVKLHLLDAAGKELDVVNTHASCFSTWNEGWMPGVDEVVLQSGDIGSRVYGIKNDRWERLDGTPAHLAEAAKLRALKYE